MSSLASDADHQDSNLSTSLPLTIPEQWLAQHGDCLYGFAVMRVRKPEVAEDMVQDTLLSAFRSKERYAGKSTERSWLVGILKNKIFDYYRKLGRETSFTDMAFLADEHSEKFADKFWIPDQGPQDWNLDRIGEYDRADFWKAFQNCLSKLPPRVADVFTLREIDNLSTDEICLTLNITSNNLWVMLHRARMALRECLEMNWFGDVKKHRE